MPRTLLLAFAVAAACAGPSTDSDVDGPIDDDPGTQIGGVDCEYDKLEVDVHGPSGQSVTSQIQTTFPDGQVLDTDCPDRGCQLELAGPGAYGLVVTAAEGSAARTITLDESHIAGTKTQDCGGTPFYEHAVTIDLVDTGGGGGDVLTSNLGLRVWASSGARVAGTVTVSDASGQPPWSRWCAVTRCWLDITGPGVHQLDFVGENGETGSIAVQVTATDHIGLNEFGDDVWEKDVALTLSK